MKFNPSEMEETLNDWPNECLVEPSRCSSESESDDVSMLMRSESDLMCAFFAVTRWQCSTPSTFDLTLVSSQFSALERHLFTISRRKSNRRRLPYFIVFSFHLPMNAATIFHLSRIKIFHSSSSNQELTWKCVDRPVSRRQGRPSSYHWHEESKKRDIRSISAPFLSISFFLHEHTNRRTTRETESKKLYTVTPQYNTHLIVNVGTFIW